MAKKKKFSATISSKELTKASTAAKDSSNISIFEDFSNGLSNEEKLSLLKNEFNHYTNSECLEDIFTSFNNDYDSSRQVIQELFPLQDRTTKSSSNGFDLYSEDSKSSSINNNNNTSPSSPSSSTKNLFHNSADYYFENSATSANAFLQITPDIFSRLHDQFGTENTQACVPIVAKDFETLGTFLLPLEVCDGAMLYKNMVRFIQRSNFGAIESPMYEEDDDDLFSNDGSTSTSAISSCSAFSTSTKSNSSSSSRNCRPQASTATTAAAPYQHDTVSYASLCSLTNMNESEIDLKEIMQIQSAIDASRAEYLRQLTVKARYCVGGEDSTEAAAIAQELCIERKRDFLYAKFPGADRSQLDTLFEINCYNLNETLRDIDAFYNFKLPKFYRNSMYSEVVVAKNRQRFAFDGMDDELRQLMAADEEEAAAAAAVAASELGLCDENDIEETAANRLSDRQFKNRINELFENRQQWHMKISHLKQKSAQFCNQKQYAISTLYTNEIAKCYKELDKLSDEIVDTFAEYSHPNNTVDLHGLIIKEVRQIIPKILQKFQNRFFPQTLPSSELARNTDSSRPGTPRPPDPTKRVAKLKFITGIGSNSSNGFGWIRNYLISFICKKNLRSLLIVGLNVRWSGLACQHQETS